MRFQCLEEFEEKEGLLMTRLNGMINSGDKPEGVPLPLLPKKYNGLVVGTGKSAWLFW